MRRLLALLTLIALAAPAHAGEAEDIFVLRSSAKAPEAVRRYSERMEWRYIGDSKVKGGAVTLVKICIPAVCRAIWPAGLKVSALLPCGNIGVYQTDGGTEISLLHPRYMTILLPGAESEAAAEIAEPLLLEMLDGISQ